MSDNGFIRLDRLKTALSQVKTKVDSDIADAISESTISLTSLINSGDASTLSEAKGYADGLKIIIDSNISNGDSSTLTSANSYTDSKISSVNLTINDLNESIPGQINLALENYTEYSDFSNHTSNTSNPHNVTAAQVGAAASSHTHVESDITDLGNYSVIGHTHTVSDITDSNTLATNLNLTTHTSNTNNPHAVTKTQVGLSNVDNTSDLDKPISTAVQSALDNLEDRIDAIDEIGSSITLASLGGASATDLSNHISDTNNPHSVTYSQTGAAAASHTHTEADITDLGSYANSSHTHMVSDITDASSLASSSHTHVEADITDLGNYASSNHTHTLSNITDITATATELNNTVNSTSNIQMQLNDARMYGFFPAWEYQHEYNIEDCIKIPCCKTTQYLECIVAGVSGSCPEWIIEETGEYYKLDEFISVVNGQCIVDGTCVWLVQDIRDARVIGSITPLLWRPMYVYDAFDNYGIGLVNTVRLYDGRSSKQSDMSKSDNLKFIRLLKRIMGSAIFTLNMSSIFYINGNSNINSSSSTQLSHIGGALVILDWCFRPFDYLSSSHYNDIDSRASKYIENMLSHYNSEFSVNLTKTQIVNDAIAKKTKIYNNQLTNDYLYFESNAIGKYGIMQSGNYGIFQDAGLPNLNSSLGYIHSHGTTSNLTTSNGTLKWVGNSNNISNSTYQYRTVSGNTQYANINFNASRGNSIYGNSTTVQPNALYVYYYMKY